MMLLNTIHRSARRSKTL